MYMIILRQQTMNSEIQHRWYHNRTPNFMLSIFLNPNKGTKLNFPLLIPSITYGNIVWLLLILRSKHHCTNTFGERVTIETSGVVISALYKLHNPFQHSLQFYEIFWPSMLYGHYIKQLDGSAFSPIWFTLVHFSSLGLFWLISV